MAPFSYARTKTPVACDLPRGVLRRTFSRSKSPELMEANCGKRASSLSDCVPFPTPGAPTRMIRAAFLNCLVGCDMLRRWPCRRRLDSQQLLRSQMWSGVTSLASRWGGRADWGNAGKTEMRRERRSVIADAYRTRRVGLKI